ncbi:EAL domain-containing protein [Photobacterium nomapromontoriensis]
MSAVTYLYGRSGIVGLCLGLLFYYGVLDFCHSGVGIFYSVLVTTLLMFSLSLIDTLKDKFHIDKIAFCYYVFFIPGISSFILAILAPNDFNITQALNLCLTDAIGVLLTAPITVLFLHGINTHKDIKSALRTLSDISKSNLLYNIIIITCILVVLFYAKEVKYSYVTYMILLPFVMLAALNFSELTQIILIIIGYNLLFNNGLSSELTDLNTKLSLFFMFSLIIYIMLDYKMSQRKESARYTKHLYFDNQSHFGTYQKLNHDTSTRNDFLVAAIDLSSVFMFPINKRDNILQHIATYIKNNTDFYQHSYILYDISALIIIIENNMRAISRLEKLPQGINRELLAKNTNFNVDRVFYCGCKKGRNITQAVNILHVNLRIVDKFASDTLINCDNAKFDNYLAFLEQLDDDNIQLLRQNYQAINNTNLQCFELLSEFSINGDKLNTNLVFQYAQKLGRIEMLEKHIVLKALTYIHTLPTKSFHYAAINLSPDFISSTFAINELFTIAENLTLPLNKICIEIVETGVIENPLVLHKNLERLRERGIHIALDDFGSGHASYDQLLKMPIDCVKISGSLISDCHIDPIKANIINHLREITAQLNIDIVAESIEKPEEQQLLMDLGINYLQGVLIHQPTPLTAVG